MVIIFAKVGTDEKVAVIGNRLDIPGITLQLNEQLAGQWAWVDELQEGRRPHEDGLAREILKFNDGEVYRGFDPNKLEDRYSKAIQFLKQ